ncbi:MAG: OsmC family protein [Pseudorhodobacter sp.]
MTHEYTTAVKWTGNTGQGTATYKGYKRTWDIAAPGKEVVHCSNDPVLGGDPSKLNPEDILLSALSACHMLWYLHLASTAKIKVLAYEDTPLGEGENLPDGSGRFLSATLKPKIEIEAGGDVARAKAIHHEIHKYCFIARSVNFPVSYDVEIIER